ncbi:uncharacterized protein [Arachis hypogaea]|uniref:uncharacterized protein n=1 Tax=Arachis hypogaea TaxID=3818 RepID=UPI000DEC54F4|nr:uncharacterized protein LOC112747642 [Arachis hypogaea]XP_025651566.1 uncharacterized protein LOC112747642 [Arachis hypogaea]XP_025698215.1 uncharacterized protein LOC112800250 [Arachis hypogaea]XP_025698216.1 uncharacterized protein LOC112800250 [Arachis hypogaea]XP_029148662.1 uncharacterized protein LOC112747642 [Arachis hypogaea]XP_029148663.1 uncharacterized protein LOC112747642 [Arachis hypogaea]XP_029154025.1 uncharacterized protein LOC112800250 [Arachis hypogaea]XP_029154026.1 unc
MENVCDVNHLDADVLLPPRKRLLAGLKKQNSDCVDAAASPSTIAASCVTVCEGAPSSSSSYSSEFEARLKNLLSAHSSNPNLTPEEVVEASKAAAVAASKTAQAARAAAEEKAEIAAKAIAAAKSALDLVASFSDESVNKERNLKKNKQKKHLPVQLLYKKYQPVENCGTDEELARKLHRAMNSSPRITKNSPNSESKGSRQKKPRSSSSMEMTEGSDAGMANGQDLSLNNGHAAAGKIDSEGSIQEVCSSKEDKKGLRYDRSNQMEMDNGEAESSQSKEKITEDLSTTGKKRGRVKLKKLPLSICTSKDRAQPKEGVRGRSTPISEMNSGNHPVDSIPLFPVEPSTERVMPIEATSMWKCQEFKAPACIKQNKAVQS